MNVLCGTVQYPIFAVCHHCAHYSWDGDRCALPFACVSVVQWHLQHFFDTNALSGNAQHGMQHLFSVGKRQAQALPASFFFAVAHIQFGAKNPSFPFVPPYVQTDDVVLLVDSMHGAHLPYMRIV